MARNNIKNKLARESWQWWYESKSVYTTLQIQKAPVFSYNYLHVPRDAAGQLFFVFLKKLRSKSVRFFIKLYPRVLGLVATLDPKVIFIILIIILNLN
jgi:hypothetical protein